MAYYFDFPLNPPPKFPARCPVCLDGDPGTRYWQEYRLRFTPLRFIIDMGLQALGSVLFDLLLFILSFGYIKPTGRLSLRGKWQLTEDFSFWHPICDRCCPPSTRGWQLLLMTFSIMLAPMGIIFIMPDQWISDHHDFMIVLGVGPILLGFPAALLISYLRRLPAQRAISRSLSVVSLRPESATYRVGSKAYMDSLAAENQIAFREGP